MAARTAAVAGVTRDLGLGRVEVLELLLERGLPVLGDGVGAELVDDVLEGRLGGTCGDFWSGFSSSSCSSGSSSPESGGREEHAGNLLVDDVGVVFHLQDELVVLLLRRIFGRRIAQLGILSEV